MSGIRIAMWSGPRNLSTAMMRSFENRHDTVVADEPFYAHYLYKTKIDHPGKEEIIASQSTDWAEVANMCTGDIPDGKPVWYQKQMAQHNLKGCDLVFFLREAPLYSVGVSWIVCVFVCLFVRIFWEF